MPDLPRFVHLRVHSEYSLAEGAVRLNRLTDLCHKHQMPSVAVTDTNNMFGALESSEMLAAAGIQPIHGMQARLAYRDMPDPDESMCASVVLLAQDEAGYKSLLKLNTCLYLRSSGRFPYLTLADLEGHQEGLILLTGGSGGPIGRLLQGREFDLAEKLLLKLSKTFNGRCYVELQRHPEEGSDFARREETTEERFVALAYKHALPLVATNDAHFPERQDFESHDVLLCIDDNANVDQKTGRRMLTREHFFKSQQEMAEIFEDLPEAIENTVAIARRCSFRATSREPLLPVYTENESDELRRQAEVGLEERLKSIAPSVSVDDYRQRLEYELTTIEKTGFAGYFLIVADFVKWSKSQNIPVGPGRGSGAGSLVAYALTITDIDPLRFSLLFERFLNPERISIPDFDIDFCQERRDEVIKYVRKKYGHDRVAHIITFGALQSRMAVRDVGRVLGIRYRNVDRLAKLIPREGVANVSVDRAMAEEERLRTAAREDPAVESLFKHASAIEGLLRNASTHAAGVVIANQPLDEIVPLYMDSRSKTPATQFTMKWAEKAGLVKFDFLGLKTLTLIRSAVNMLRRRGIDLDIDNIPLNDKRTFDMCSAAATVGVFQLESSGMQDTLRKMKPNCIEDIVALVALYRPGPMQNIDLYCEIKNGNKISESFHPSIDHILKETHGIIVYQEQVMQIAQLMGGYSLGGADLLRRAMGKKIKNDMNAERPNFLAGAKDNGVDAKTADKVWAFMARFAEYGFNKAHATAYAVVSYQTAWLKANHPAEFLAAVMSCDVSDSAKIEAYVREARSLGIEIVAPDVNRSHPDFEVEEGAILYGLCAIKGAGREAMGTIASERAGNPFKDLLDFASRVNLKKIGKLSLEKIARAGVFDSMDRNRKRVFESIPTLISYSASMQKERNTAHMSLFGEAQISLPPPNLPDVDDWTQTEWLAEEFESFGYYFSGHPLDAFSEALEKRNVVQWASLAKCQGGGKSIVRFAGIVTSVQRRSSEKGNSYAFLSLSDPSGTFEMIVFSNLLESKRELFEVGKTLVLDVEVCHENDQTKLRVDDANPLETVAKSRVQEFRIFFNDASAPAAVKDILGNVKHDKRTARKKLCFVPLSPDIGLDVIVTPQEVFPVNTKMKRAISSLDGVVKVKAT